MSRLSPVVSFGLVLGVIREFLSPRIFGPRPVELLLFLLVVVILVPGTGILDTEEDLLELEAPVDMLDLPGLE